ncbi:MAG: galactose mutarotase [Candidatus Marinimicrobia bacterium]|nr:galactose mutarotase [Candidatus Neomarinimicrobiota bacterium]
MKYTKINFGQLANGTTIYKYILENDHGMTAEVMTYGATVTSLRFDGKDLTLGFDTLSEWENNPIYAGVTAGRYANRIAGGKFTIDGQLYELSKNESTTTLHGGIVGFDKEVWGAQVDENEDSISVIMFRVSPDGEQGFPGNLDVYVTYTLTNNNELQIDYTATTDISTHVNLTHHSYFNLSDEPTIENHQIMLNADYFTPVTGGALPTGEIASVENSAMDFRLLTKIKERNAEIGGIDHNFVLNKDDEMSLAARVFAPDTGIEMDVITSKPGIQFYSGKFIDNLICRSGVIYSQFGGLCLEPQFFPDTPNNPGFPSSLLTPENEYFHRIIYRFTKKIIRK